MLLKQSSTTHALVFLMVDSTDHVTPKTGLSPTVTLSKNGAAFASPAGAVAEIANGWYKVAGNATDTATLGALVLHATGAAADPADMLFEVIAADPQLAAFGASTVASVATANAALVKIQAATYDAATIVGSVITFSNAATHTLSAGARSLG